MAVAQEYYQNEARKLKAMVNSIIEEKFKNVLDDIERDEFYGVATDVFVDVLDDWDQVRPFDIYFRSCLRNRLYSLQTRNNAQKRKTIETVTESTYNVETGEYESTEKKVYGHACSLEAPISQDLGNDLTLMDVIPNREEKDMEEISDNMREYLSGLTRLQREIIIRKARGEKVNQIIKELGITLKVYNNEYALAKSYKNTSTLLGNHESRLISEKESTVLGNTNEHFKTESVSVEMYLGKIHDRQIRLDYPLQRSDEQWPSERKGNFIVSVINGDGILPLILCEQPRKTANGDFVDTWVIDGKQRTTVLDAFINGLFRISKNVEEPIISYQDIKRDENGNVICDDGGSPVYQFEQFDVRGKKFADLPKFIQDKIKGYNFRYDLYLGCTSKDIERHIRRFNASQPMNGSQIGITHLGTQFGIYVQKIAKKDFFKDTFNNSTKRKDYDKHLIVEAIMMINFFDSWSKKSDQISDYIKNNGTKEIFDQFADFVDRIDVILNPETRKLFSVKDSPVWFKLFARFDKLGLDDDKFGEFLDEFVSNLSSREINGTTWTDLEALRSTKDMKTITNKYNYIEAAMFEYLGVNASEKADHFDGITDDIAEYVDTITKDSFVPAMKSETDRQRVALQTALVVNGNEDVSDSVIQKAIDDGVFTKELLDKTLETFSDFVDDWAINVPSESAVFEHIPVMIYAYFKFGDINGNGGLKWFENLANGGDTVLKLSGIYDIDRKHIDEAYNSLKTSYGESVA